MANDEPKQLRFGAGPLLVAVAFTAGITVILTKLHGERGRRAPARAPAPAPPSLVPVGEANKLQASSPILIYNSCMTGGAAIRILTYIMDTDCMEL